MRGSLRFSNARYSAHRPADGRHYSARFVPTSKYSLFVCLYRTRVRSSISAGAAASGSLGPPQSEYQEFRRYLDEPWARV